MDLQTLIEGKFDPVGAIRLLAYRVALLEAREEHSVVEGMPEEPKVQLDTGAPAEPARSGDTPDGKEAAATGTGDDTAGADASAPKATPKVAAPKKAATSKRKASS